MTAEDTSQIVYDLCTEWEVSNDGRTFTSQMNSGFSNLTPKKSMDLKAQMGGELRVNELPGSRNRGFMMNVKKKPLSDPRVRKAIPGRAKATGRWSVRAKA